MQKKFFIIILSISFLIVLVMFSCSRKKPVITTSGGGTTNIIAHDKDDDKYKKDDDKYKKDDDKSSIQTSRKSGGICEGKSRCEEWCDDLFGSTRDRDECFELTVNEVEGMYQAFEEDDGILAEPDEDDLGDIHPDDIRTALKIDDDIWSDLIKKYNSREAKHTLMWIADEPEIFNAIGVLDNDEEEQLMRKLLERFKNDISSAMTSKLDDDDDEVFSVLADDNEEAVELVHDLLINDCLSEAEDETIYTGLNQDYQDGACSLGEVYCKKDDDGDYIFEDVFEMIIDYDDYLEEYIEDDSEGLALDDGDSDEIEEVCEAFCGAVSGAEQCS